MSSDSRARASLPSFFPIPLFVVEYLMLLLSDIVCSSALMEKEMHLCLELTVPDYYSVLSNEKHVGLKGLLLKWRTFRITRTRELSFLYIIWMNKHLLYISRSMRIPKSERVWWEQLIVKRCRGKLILVSCHSSFSQALTDSESWRRACEEDWQNSWQLHFPNTLWYSVFFSHYRQV